jgi:hypothetical protein
LAGFDKEVQKEQERTAKDRDAAAAARADGSAIEAAEQGDEIARDRSGDLKSERSAKDSQSSADGKGEERGGVQQTGGGGVAATPIPSGSDDDIIARRLRKAAEDETDPELKEKLWKEYRDYKANTQGAGR